MFLFKEYEKAIEFKRANKGENKKLVNGCQSIYLDIYMNGRRQYEFLKLYIIPEHNQADKKRNVETLNLANAIKAQKIWKYIIKLTDLIITDCPI